MASQKAGRRLSSIVLGAVLGAVAAVSAIAIGAGRWGPEIFSANGVQATFRAGGVVTIDSLVLSGKSGDKLVGVSLQSGEGVPESILDLDKFGGIVPIADRGFWGKREFRLGPLVDGVPRYTADKRYSLVITVSYVTHHWLGWSNEKAEVFVATTPTEIPVLSGNETRVVSFKAEQIGRLRF